MADAGLPVAEPAVAHTTREWQLDVLRGLAVILAMGWHFNTYGPYAIFNVLQAPGREFGWAGVDLFFVLSGFLVGKLILRELSDTGGFDYRRFLVRRMFRLWPVLYLYVFVQMAIGKYPWSAFVPQLLLHVQNYWTQPFGHLWSLAVEEQFYLLAGLLLPFCSGHRPRTMMTAFAMIIAASTTLRFVAEHAGVAPLVLQAQTQYRVDGLALGLMLAGCQLYYPDRFVMLQRFRLWLFAIAVAGFGSLAYFGMTALGFTIAAWSSAALILSAKDADFPRLTRPLLRVVAVIGLYSYSIYIWHNAIGRVGRNVADRVGVEGWDVTVSYAATLVGAILISLVLEWPLIRLRDRMFPSPARMAQPSP